MKKVLGFVAVLAFVLSASPVMANDAANPCAANPCAANPCAANPCAANPCAATAKDGHADHKGHMDEHKGDHADHKAGEPKGDHAGHAK